MSGFDSLNGKGLRMLADPDGLRDAPGAWLERNATAINRAYRDMLAEQSLAAHRAEQERRS